MTTNEDFEKSGFMENGYVFIPNQCFEEMCDIHLVLHGCGGYGIEYLYTIGYNDWAVTNNLIMLYPQVQNTGLYGYEDCFDTFGYTNELFATNEGIQPKAIKKMFDRLIEKKEIII